MAFTKRRKRSTRGHELTLGVVASALLLLVALSGASGYSIYCGDERYCDDGQTCCKSRDAGTHYFCCQVRGATCCSDMQSCCPPEFPVCDLQAGGCVGKHSSGHGADAHRKEIRLLH